MKVTLKFFASVREITGTRVQTVEMADGTTVAGAWKLYVEKYPRLANMGLAYAVNREYSGPERVLKDGDELALIPPVSGGCVASLPALLCCLTRCKHTIVNAGERVVHVADQG